MFHISDIYPENLRSAVLLILNPKFLSLSLTVSVSQVIHKSYKALIQWMSVCRDVSSITDELRQGSVHQQPPYRS